MYVIYDKSTVAYPMASSIHAYFARCIEVGAIEGSLGDQQLLAEARELVRCLHHVLAGGKVSCAVEQRGSMDIYNDLERLFDVGQRDANEINAAAGYYVSVIP
jgi:hypothetical protein